ncbi:hypothetical protein Gogos_006442 [Gossypium gossypioides]|uniref:NADH:quinone oxidoreductase/Mrp antiporter transmembrane domain-containing protein n=1 Tax=Gossypium gossypioides TaxID=34282 RepID=A0A7J9C5W2_GOSGO|nr:hypothetical protein [Gossypium gossypioides]
MAIAEFLLFVLIATLGGMFLFGANYLITIFVALECFSLCSYLLSGYTKKDVLSNEATTKYLLMGGASSSILVHGFSWLYGSSGREIELQEILNGLINTQMYNSPGILIALIFITVGIGFTDNSNRGGFNKRGHGGNKEAEGAGPNGHRHLLWRKPIIRSWTSNLHLNRNKFIRVICILRSGFGFLTQWFIPPISICTRRQPLYNEATEDQFDHLKLGHSLMLESFITTSSSIDVDAIMKRAQKTVDDADVRVQTGGNNCKRLEVKKSSRSTEKSSGSRLVCHTQGKKLANSERELTPPVLSSYLEA